MSPVGVSRCPLPSGSRYAQSRSALKVSCHLFPDGTCEVSLFASREKLADLFRRNSTVFRLRNASGRCFDVATREGEIGKGRRFTFNDHAVWRAKRGPQPEPTSDQQRRSLSSPLPRFITIGEMDPIGGGREFFRFTTSPNGDFNHLS